jgi:YegS/Rv2252/BmrU family lipid kinase
MEKNYRIKTAMPVKLIFNPGSGKGSNTNEPSPQRLLDIIQEMQHWNLIPEVFLIEPDCDLEGAIQDGLKRGIELFVVCGGDGTISPTARILSRTAGVLGVIPQGTQNNIALSLEIPTEISEAVALLRTGTTIQSDMGLVTCGEKTKSFLEVCSVGLVSALFPSGDDIQHGEIGQIGVFLDTLVSTPPADIHLTMSDGEDIQNKGYVVLVSNMPYLGLHYKLGPQASYKDGLLDVLYFADLNKLDLLGYVLFGTGENQPEDERIQHYHVSEITIKTEPEMPVMIDGDPFGEGNVHIKVQQGVLNIIVPSHVARVKPAEEITKE